ERDRRCRAGRGPHLLPGSLAQEAPPQAPAGQSRLRGAAGAQAAPGRALAPRHRLARLCGTDVGRARRDPRLAQPRRSARARAAAALAARDPLRGPRPETWPRRLGPAVRQDLTGTGTEDWWIPR